MNIKRDLTIQLEKELNNDEVLLIIGARQAGKTTVLRQLEEIIKKDKQDIYFLSLEDPEYLELLNKAPKNLLKIFPFDLKKRNFVLIDEVQYLKNPSNFLKYFFDTYKGKIKIIATGSSAFYLDRKFKDSLVGRKKIFHLATLSFREYLRFMGTTYKKSLNELSKKDFNKLSLSEKEEITREYELYLIYGGYPKVVLGASYKEKIEILRDLVFSYIKKDIFEANIKQEDVFYKLLRILASQSGGLVNTSELASTLGISRSAIDDYLYLMQKSFHIRLITPFYKNLRKEITKMPKVYFLDLGLRNFLLNNFKPFRDREDKGELLENALFRELYKKYDFSEIKFWRTVQKQEVDFVVDGNKAYEVKASPSQFKKSKYRSFFEVYPDIDFSIVSFDASINKKGGLPIIDVWKI